MRRLFLVVLVLALAGTAGATRVSVGVWGGLRTGEFAPSLGSFSSSFLRTVTANELGGQIAWEAWKPLCIRARFSRISGSISYEENPRSPYVEPVERFELKGYPLVLEVLPTFQIGENVLIRAGGGVTYFDLTGEQTFVGNSNIVNTTPEFGIKGRGAHFLVGVEGMFWKNFGLEADYEKGAARFKCSLSPIHSTPWDYYDIDEVYATTIEAYRLGLAFHF
jgi:hypothetical protein